MARYKTAQAFENILRLLVMRILGFRVYSEKLEYLTLRIFTWHKIIAVELLRNIVTLVIIKSLSYQTPRSLSMKNIPQNHD